MLNYTLKIPAADRHNLTRDALLALGGSSLVVVMMAWVAFLLWLAVEVLIAIAR